MCFVVESNNTDPSHPCISIHISANCHHACKEINYEKKMIRTLTKQSWKCIRNNGAARDGVLEMYWAVTFLTMPSTGQDFW